MRVERGLAFNVCLDRDCESLDEAVQTAFDRAWDCPEPDCEGDLRILRRGGLIAGCEHYPDCDAGFVIPTGVVDGECACGLPTFDTTTGRRCLDATCDRYENVTPTGDAAPTPALENDADTTLEDDPATALELDQAESSAAAATDSSATAEAPTEAEPDDEEPAELEARSE